MNIEVKNIVLLLSLLITLPLTGIAAELPRTGQRTCFDQYGGIIDHTGSGQDGDLQNGAIWPEPRFEDNGDGTVTDNLTNLMWMYDGGCIGKMSWPAAMQCSNRLNAPGEQSQVICKLETGCTDWFLPSIEQLETLFNGEEPSIPQWLASWGIINIQNDHYWSTTISPNPYTAWGFHFNSGVAEQTAKVEHGFVLLARHSDSFGIPRKASPPDPSSAITSPRFVDNGDGTVTDTKTSLMWLKNGTCLNSSSWKESFKKITELNTAPLSWNCTPKGLNYTDWALPNRNELRSLIDHSRDFPALPEAYPFVNVQPDYWTSTTAAHSPAQAYELDIGTGELQTTDKEELHHIWPVRPVEGYITRERTTGKTSEQVFKKVHSMFHSSGERITISWPAVRFADQGDGTLIDNKNGLMWLKDAICFGKRRWEAGFSSVERLNQYPDRVGCKEYTQTYEDWRLPTLDMMLELTADAKGEPAVWLQEQGAAEVPSRDYWTVTENSLNIYYAWALNLKQGTLRNYSKTFPLFIWPVRRPINKGWVHPKPLVLVNNSPDSLNIIQGDDITVTAAISEIDNIVEADFKIWYEAPDKSKWWLSTDGTWQTKETILYHGNLFPLSDYPVFTGRTTEMATGLYTIHFDITVLLEKNDSIALFPTTFSNTYTLAIDRALPDQANLLWTSGN